MCFSWSEESKAYRLYDPISLKIIVIKDVVFEEDNIWDWNKKHNEVILAYLKYGDDNSESDASANFGDPTETNEHNNSEESRNDGSNGANGGYSTHLSAVSSLASRNQR